MTSFIHQMLPNLIYGDAVSTQALEIRNFFRQKGIGSNIYVRHSDGYMSNEVISITEKLPEPGTALIYHHSIGSEVTRQAMGHSGTKICIYHNITPSHFFKESNHSLHHLTELGRDQMTLIRDSVSFSYGDSLYNCRELKDAGFSNVELLPIIIDPSKWDIDPENLVLERFSDKIHRNILFVGRISPNKCQKELVRLFFFLKQIIEDPKLFLVGSYDEKDPYYREVMDEIRRLKLEKNVFLTGHVSIPVLKSYYLVSDLFISFSEHEGFGVPLVEAMWFDLPVLAYKSSAVPETLGDAAFLFTDKSDLKRVASLVKIVLEDQDICNSILKAQRRRRSSFLPEMIHPTLEGLISRLVNDPPREDLKNGPFDMPRPLNVAFVVQRYGPKVNGGAESHCRVVAERMTKYWNVDVLTTCAEDYLTWNNYYPPGISFAEGVKIRRFEVDFPRSVESFNRFSSKLIQKKNEKISIEENEEWMKQQGPFSTSLFDFIKNNKHNYDCFIFFTYLYASTYFGLKEVYNKAWMVPTAHDEWPIYLPIFNELFSKPAGFIFNTIEERDFLRKKFPQLPLKGPVSGVGLNVPENIYPEKFRQNWNISEDFILYLGRIDPSKGCPILFDHFQKFKKDHPSDLKLVLAGKSSMDIPEHPDIIHLGFVEEQTKWDTLAACRLLVNPSKYESLSMVLLEAWTLGKPVLVNEECEVLKNQTKRANGGKSFSNYPSFVSGLLTILDDEVELQEAKDFVSRNYSWEKIERDYLEMT